MNSLVRDAEDIWGSSAKISFHDVQLCNELEWDPAEEQSRPYCQSTVWTQIVGQNPDVSDDDDNVYIQTGWIRQNEKLYKARSWVYCEGGTRIDGVYTFYRDWNAADDPAETRQYRLELIDKSAGTWEIYYRERTAPWETKTYNFWANTSGRRVFNNGELNYLQSDMPGTTDNKCDIKELKYKLGQNAAFTNQATRSTVSNTHKSKFGAERVSSTHVRIWDKVDDCD